jgi:hypothetical protein
MSDFFPQKPPIQTNVDTFAMKGWFEKVWQSLKGWFWPAPIQTSSFSINNEIGFYPVDSTSGAVVVTLPTAAGQAGRKFTVKHTAGSNAVTLTPQAGDTIDSASTLVVPLGVSITLISGGNTIWYVVDTGQYTTGTWTPSWGGSTGDGTVTYGTRTGRYIRIGNTVWISFRINISAIPAAPTGDILVKGLPFAIGNTDEGQRLMGYPVFVNNWGGNAPRSFIGNGTTTEFRLYKSASADARDNSTVVLATDLLATSHIIGTAVYYTD